MNLNQLLEITNERNASDLHLAVGYVPILRVHGELIPLMEFPVLTDQEMLALVVTVLNPAQKAKFEKEYELDFALPFYDKSRFRVNLFKQQGHTTAALRKIPLIIPQIESLGVPVSVTKLAQLRQGLILVTGPTGHGKSTTIASLINMINLTRAAHVITVEDPIEYIYPKAKSLISQRELHFDTLGWTSALQSALREDPDIVVVGEMRDLETIASAITIAETGHLVFATLHTNSASQSIDRIIDVFPAHQQPQIRSQLASTLEAVISQRLVPTTLPGRALAAEVLLRVPALASIIRDGKMHMIDSLIQTSAEYGMVSLEASLVKLVRDGKITLEVARNYSLRPDMLSKLLGR